MRVYSSNQPKQYVNEYDQNEELNKQPARNQMYVCNWKKNGSRAMILELLLLLVLHIQTIHWEYVF